MGYAPSRRAVLFIAGQIAKLAANVYVKNAKGRAKETDNWAYWLLNKEPCGWLTPMSWKTQFLVYYLIYGNSYAWIRRNDIGEPVELTMLYPWDVYLKIDIATGQPAYTITLPWTLQRLEGVATSDILHLKNVGDMYTGDSHKVLGLSLNLQNYASKFFLSGGAGRSHVEMPAVIANDKSKAEEFMNNYKQQFLGSENAHKTIFTGPGVTITDNDTDNQKSQMLETQEYDLITIANLFGIPASYLGAKNNTSYGSLEAESRTLLQSIDPLIISFEQETSKKLLTDFDYNTGRRYVELCREQLIQIEVEKQKAMLIDELNNSIISWEEMREIENLPTERDEDMHWRRPANIVPDTDEPPAPVAPVQPPMPPEQPQPPEAGNTDQTAMRLTKSIMQRFATRIDKSKQPLKEHKEILLEQLNGWNNSQEFVDILFAELSEVLPEQRKNIINNYSLEVLCK
jgi:HK97 family phage portal protein